MKIRSTFKLDILYFSTLSGKELYMFRRDLLSIIRSLNTVYTAIGIFMLVLLASASEVRVELHPDQTSRQPTELA
jgi:hypothetical protein